MASKSFVPEEDYSCPVCRDIFKDPVLLSCSHSFCNECLQKWWRQKRRNACPICKEIHPTDHLPRNLALKNLCEAFVQERQQRASKRKRTSSGSEDLCSLHAEKLKLFCQECQQLVCVVCLHSKEHTNHSFRPIDEAALDHKEEVQRSLKTLQEKLEDFKTAADKSDKTEYYIGGDAWYIERQIKKQFETLRQFLQEEEEASLTALREEEQQKSQMMNEKTEGLDRDILTLSNNIRAIEEELRAEHISFLQNYKTTMERAQFTLQDPQPLSSGALINKAKHLGNLAFRVWNKMKDIVSYTPVILDCNTACPFLDLIDVTSVSDQGELYELPDNPERFAHEPFILGSEGFNSGTHSWEVEVGDNTDWSVGVIAESSERKGDGKTKPPTAALQFREGKYSISCTDDKWSAPPISFSLEQKPQRIRVQLVWKGTKEGKLLFSDADTNAHIGPQNIIQSFTDTMFPFIYTTGEDPLKILPGRVSITVEQPTVVRHDDDDDDDDMI